MERKYFLETVVPTEFDLGRTEAKAGKPKNANASASYHAGYDTPDVLHKTMAAWILKIATEGYDDAVANKPHFIDAEWPDLKDETNGTAIKGDDSRIYNLESDIPGVYQEGRDAPEASIPPGFTSPISKTPNTVIGAIGGGVLGFVGSLILGGGITSKVGATVIGAGAGALYMRSKTPGD